MVSDEQTFPGMHTVFAIDQWFSQWLRWLGFPMRPMRVLKSLIFDWWAVGKCRRPVAHTRAQPVQIMR